MSIRHGCFLPFCASRRSNVARCRFGDGKQAAAAITARIAEMAVERCSDALAHESARRHAWRGPRALRCRRHDDSRARRHREPRTTWQSERAERRAEWLSAAPVVTLMACRSHIRRSKATGSVRRPSAWARWASGLARASGRGGVRCGRGLGWLDLPSRGPIPRLARSDLRRCQAPFVNSRGALRLVRWPALRLRRGLRLRRRPRL